MEWMFLMEINVNFVLCTAPSCDDIFSLFVLFFPGVDIMENVMSWEFEPFNIIWV